MQGSADDHQTAMDLESYSLGRTIPSRLEYFERHLLVCVRCQAELDSIEPYNYIHYTRDGPFYSRITKLRTGKYLARHWGRSLEGGKEFRTCDGAKGYLVRSFFRIFREHACTARCGAAKCISVKPDRARPTIQ
jgi:hypothetical protein